MEQMMQNMKQQSLEEKLRLQHENDRLLSLQSSWENERKSMQLRLDEELQIIKSKMKEVIIAFQCNDNMHISIYVYTFIYVLLAVTF